MAARGGGGGGDMTTGGESGGADSAEGAGAGGGSSAAGAGVGGYSSTAGAGVGDGNSTAGAGIGSYNATASTGLGDSNPTAGNGTGSGNSATDAGVGDGNSTAGRGFGSRGSAAGAGLGDGAPVTGAKGRSDDLSADVGVRDGQPTADADIGDVDVTPDVSVKDGQPTADADIGDVDVTPDVSVKDGQPTADANIGDVDVTADVGVRSGQPTADAGVGDGDVTAGVGRQVRWLVLVPLAACLAIAVPDLFFDRVPPLIVLLLIGPLLACVRLGVRHTVLACCWSAVLGLAMGIDDRTVQTFAFAVHWSGLLFGCALTVYAARQRERLVATLDRAREVARITQEAVLRPISRTLGGTQVCTRYHSAALESTVGGDLYDVAVTPFGLRVLVGDVRGHGLDALRLTADTIAGFRELAYTAPDLTALTAGLDARLAPELGLEDFVTAVLAEFAPGEVRLVNCGHPAPLRAGHRIELLEPLVTAPPLGLCPDPRQYRVRLQPGDRLLLYTDGLTEARDPEGAPFPLLGEAALALREPLPDEALHALYARLIAHTGSALTDDLALVLCQPMEATVPARVP
ncbi:PP2C family protein-serine/threonine phosphatase [Streptomyces sp. NBC_00996]|uniref:PP2C family protein-serine/threonine phosphatase n=1 Tax=Streptomyces sp. NBC_00996 TaxID=2903710 RepID=UPI0038635FE8|nr:serine/threonine-protein phosphatase [Streptomyces sp. NBC_00996]